MKIETSKFGMSFVLSILVLSGAVVAQGLEDVIGVAKDVGVFQFYLPFIIAFAVLYGLLQKIQLFGDSSKGPAKGLNIIISLAIAAYVMIYTPVGITLSQFFTNLFGNAIVVVLTILVVAIFASVLKSGGIIDFEAVTKLKYYWIIALVIFILIAFSVFVASGGTAIFPGLKISPTEWLAPITGGFGISSTTLALLILIIGTGIIVWLFASSKPAPAAGGK